MTYTTILVSLEAGRSNAHLLNVIMQVAERFQAGVIGSTASSSIQTIYRDGDIPEQDSKEIARETGIAGTESRDAFGNQTRHDAQAWHLRPGRPAARRLPAATVRHGGKLHHRAGLVRRHPAGHGGGASLRC